MEAADFQSWADGNHVLDATNEAMRQSILEELATFQASGYPTRTAIRDWLNDQTNGGARRAWLYPTT